MFTLIAYAVVVLTLAVIVLSVFVVLARVLSDLREIRVQRLRRRMQNSVNEYLAGTTSKQACLLELGQDRKISLGVLVSVSGRLPRDARAGLHALFEQLHFPQDRIAALKSRRWATRIHAATQLGYMSHDAAAPALIRALDDEMLDVRLAAAQALAHLGAPQAVQPILRSLAMPATWPLQRCAEILHELGAPAVEPLLTLLSEEGPQSRNLSVNVAIRVLGMLKVAAAAPIIALFLRSPDVETRVASAKTLGQLGVAEMVPELSAALKDQAWEMRSAAAKALGELHDTDVVTPLSERLADAAWWVRFNAAESLYQLGERGRTELKTAMSGHPDKFARDICRQILEEHGEIPIPDALPA